MEDDKIISLFFERDELAIQETDHTYGWQLSTLANRILNNREDAEESVNDTYWKAWDTIPPQKPRYFYAYLASLCRHFSLNRVDWYLAAKRNAEIVTLTHEMEMCIPDTKQDVMMERREFRRVFEAFLDSLPNDSRLIFLRRYLYADTISEISQRYGMTESKVKMQLQRTREKLHDHLKKEEIYV